MAHIVKDRVWETSTTTGTGNFTLGGAVSGYQTFDSELDTADTTWYCIAMGANFEVGIGTFTSPATLARTTVLESTNADAAVNWGAGTKDVFITAPGVKLKLLNDLLALAYKATVGVGEIDDAAVTLAKQANLAESTIIGRAAGAGTGIPQALTPAQIAAIVAAASTTAAGVVELATVAEAGTGTDAVRAVTPAGLFPAEVDVASAGTTAIGAAASSEVRITGTTTITAFDTVASGIRRLVRFAGILTLTHNATSLILPGGFNVVTAAGDTAEIVSEGSGNWRVRYYERASGHPLPTNINTIASAATTDLGSTVAQSISVTGTTTITSFGSTAPVGAIKYVLFTDVLSLTHNGTSLKLPTAENIITAVDDNLVARHVGSGDWRVVSYQRADGTTVGAKTKWKTFTRAMTAASGSVAYTGVGFKPIGLVISEFISGTGNVTVGGMADSNRQGDSAFASGGFFFFSAGAPFAAVIDGSNHQMATITSYDADGFTLSWTKTGTPTGTATFNVLCLR